MLNDRRSPEVSERIALKLTNGYDVYGTEDGVIIVQVGDKKLIAQGQGRILKMAELSERYIATFCMSPLLGRCINIWDLNDFSKKPKSLFNIPLNDHSSIKSLEIADGKLICSTESAKHQIELEKILKKCKTKELSVEVAKSSNIRPIGLSSVALTPSVPLGFDKERIEACRRVFNSSVKMICG